MNSTAGKMDAAQHTGQIFTHTNKRAKYALPESYISANYLDGHFYTLIEPAIAAFSMSAYGGKGPMTNAVLWVLVVILAIFVALRLYTRKQILNSIGADDYLTVLALVRNNELSTPIPAYSLRLTSGRSFTFYTQSSSL